MTVHCSTTMVSLAGGDVLLSSYTNNPSSDRGTGSPETHKQWQWHKRLFGRHTVTFLWWKQKNSSSYFCVAWFLLIESQLWNSNCSEGAGWHYASQLCESSGLTFTAKKSKQLNAAMKMYRTTIKHLPDSWPCLAAHTWFTPLQLAKFQLLGKWERRWVDNDPVIRNRLRVPTCSCVRGQQHGGFVL